MDAIDKRNFKEKMANSIIKRQNVQYISQEELERIEREKAQEVLERERLKKEKELEEAKIKAQIEAARKEQEFDYNSTTNAYSGAYGRDDVVDEVTKGQIEKILEEKESALRRTVENTLDQS